MILGSGLRCTDRTIFAMAETGLSTLLKQSLIKVSSPCHLQYITNAIIKAKRTFPHAGKRCCQNLKSIKIGLC